VSGILCLPCFTLASFCGAVVAVTTASNQPKNSKRKQPIVAMGEIVDMAGEIVAMQAR
jgi:hypothetical protein